MDRIDYSLEEAYEHELAKLAHRILRLKELDDDDQHELCFALAARSKLRLLKLLTK